MRFAHIKVINLKGKLFLPFILILLTIIPTCIPDAISLEAPDINGEKSVSPQRCLAGETITVSITLTGTGDIFPTSVDVVLILDKSGSMRGEKIKDAKEAAKRFLDFTNEIDKVGLVTFSNSPTIDYDLHFMNSTNKENLMDEIDTYSASGSTNIYDSIITANDILTDSPRANAPKVEVLLTDSQHNYPTFLKDSDFAILAEQAKDKGIIIYTVGLGSDVNAERLQMIANITKGRYFFAPTSDDLKGIFEDIAGLLNFAGTNIEVTDSIPSFITYNGDATTMPDEITSNGETILKWDVGSLRIGEEWMVIYTCQANRAIESGNYPSQSQIKYIKIDKTSGNKNLKPGFIYNDISLTNLVLEKTRLNQGETNKITVSVKSIGLVQRTFDVEIKYNNTVISNQPIILDPDQTKNILIAWNTSKLDEGKYTIAATADPNEAIWEQDRTDNKLTAEVEVMAVSEFPFFLLFVVLLLILIVPIIAGTMYSKPRIGRPICENCGDFLFYDKRNKRWYCSRCGRYL